MNKIVEHSIAIAEVKNHDGTTKVRPIYVLEYDGERVRFLSITSQYASKSEAMQKVYFVIQDWSEAGLDKPSYIDVYKSYIISDNKIIIDYIGELSELDEERLWQFIKKQGFFC